MHSVSSRRWNSEPLQGLSNGSLMRKFLYQIFQRQSITISDLMFKSRSCQKQHWKTHKPICRLTVNNAQRAEVAGVSARKDALQARVYKYYQNLAVFGANALGLQKNRNRTGARSPRFSFAHIVPHRDQCFHDLCRTHFC